jgi:hypothetical protein
MGQKSETKVDMFKVMGKKSEAKVYIFNVMGLIFHLAVCL